MSFIASAVLSSPFPFSFLFCVYMVWEAIYQNTLSVRGALGSTAVRMPCTELAESSYRVLHVQFLEYGMQVLEQGSASWKGVCCILNPISTMLLSWGLESNFLQCCLLLPVFCSQRNKALTLLCFKAHCIHPSMCLLRVKKMEAVTVTGTNCHLFCITLCNQKDHLVGHK